MPTQASTYNSRVTDESLEKRFRDTFKSQGGAELVDDLYAQGVIVPVVDFTQAATGDVLDENLQTAMDFSTIFTSSVNTTSTITSTAGFYRVLGTSAVNPGTGTGVFCRIFIDDGVTKKNVWGWLDETTAPNNPCQFQFDFIVFLRSGDTLKQESSNNGNTIESFVRQIATVNGDLVNPTGFTSS